MTWVRPRHVAQVHFHEWTAAGKMRNTTFLGLRSDKAPEDCELERPKKATARRPAARKTASRTKRPSA